MESCEQDDTEFKVLEAIRKVRHKQPALGFKRLTQELQTLELPHVSMKQLKEPDLPADAEEQDTSNPSEVTELEQRREII